MYDEKLAEKFFAALDDNDMEQAETSYRNYMNYIDSLKSLDLQINYNWHVENRVRDYHKRFMERKTFI